MQCATTSIGSANQVETFEQFVELNRSVDGHQGYESDWFARHRYVCGLARRFGPAGLHEVSKHLYSRMRDPRNIHKACSMVDVGNSRELKADGITAKRLRDKFCFDRAMRAEFDPRRNGSAKRRLSRTRKKLGTGKQPIRLPAVWRSVVFDRCIWQVLEPFLDPTLSDYSFGGRPDAHLYGALEAAEKFARAGRKTWVCVQIADAFETVPQGPLLQLLKAAIPVRPAEEIKQHRRSQKISEGVHSLLAKIIRTPSRLGIWRNAETSELFMNLFFNEFIDRPWRRQSAGLPLIHHIDSLLVPCISRDEANDAIKRLTKLLEAAGWRLKEAEAGDEQIVDLGNGETAIWCGARVWGRGRNLNSQF